MRRSLLLLLSLLMLVQSTWAAVAACCLDEATSQVAAAQLLPQAGDEGPAAADAQHLCELGHCHCHHACVVVGAEPPVDLGAHRSAAPRVDGPPRPESHVPAALDRPNWRRA